SRDRQKPSCQQGCGVMAADILRMNIIAKFELWSFVSTVVLKCRHYAKPRTVTSKAKRPHSPTLEKVCGGLSTDEFQSSFVRYFNSGSSINFCSWTAFR